MNGREFLHWDQPYALLLLLPLLLLLWPSWKATRNRRPALDWSSLDLVTGLPGVAARYEGRRPGSWLLLAALLGIVALARPQRGLEHTVQTTQGIDIVLCLDTSTSMQVEDLEPNRLRAAIEVSKRFVEGRPGDRIGLVCFGGLALTQCPLTSDHESLVSYLDRVEPGQTGMDGTAIGTGIATSVNRLRKANGKSRVVVLLTDGRNNAGEIDPLAAADLAKKLGVRVYTIGAASDGLAPVRVRDPFGNPRSAQVRVDLDEDTLRAIAQRTGGRFFRATDTESLNEIYAQIDKLEKNDAPARSQVDYRELYDWPLLGGIVFLLIFLVLEHGPKRERP